jgi:hypothetical protein
MITQKTYDKVYNAAEKQSKMLSGLRKSLVRQVTLNSQPKTLNRPSSRGAAEGAGERWGDVWSDDLLGRFFGRWFFTG